VDRSTFTLKLQGENASEAQKERMRLTQFNDMIRAGQELSIQDQEEYAFLLNKRTDYELGPVTEMPDGTTTQEFYAIDPWGNRSNISTKYKAGSRPLIPSSDQSSMAATQIELIADDINKFGSESENETRVSRILADLNPIQKNAIYSNAWQLANHYMTDPTSDIRTPGVAYQKAFSEIAKHYDNTSKSIFLRDLHNRVQEVVGGASTNVSWISAAQAQITEDPTSAKSKALKQALKIGVANEQMYSEWLRKKRQQSSK
jgi:hypothetical protein